jgi:cellulose synthase/poly-beta-1,6-N-acetylglucosamine synthase-like glycosyltransferase
MQSVYVWMYCRFLRSPVAAQVDANFEPKVAIVLCLRGNDPSLNDCLKSLTALDYSDYEIHIVVDEELDPALQSVRQHLLREPEIQVNIHVIREKTTSRSLKCSAILTALSNLDDSVEVVALIDADSVADKNWLKDLVHPLADRSVGATTGNRWFSPKSDDTGSLVRQFWNAAAIAQMSFYQIPWGGSLAIQRTAISKCDLIESWSHAFCEDTLLTGRLGRHGLRVVRVPGLIIANQESTNLSEAFRWIVRQLLTVRLYHRDWPLVLVHALFLGVCLVIALVSIGTSLATNNLMSAITVLAAIVLYNSANAYLLRAIASGNENAVRARGNPIQRTRMSVPAILIAMLFTQVIQPVAALTAAFTRRISWRGITYSIGPNDEIEMVRYQPYREVLDQRGQRRDKSIE